MAAVRHHARVLLPMLRCLMMSSTAVATYAVSSVALTVP